MRGTCFIRKILDGEVIELFGDGTQIRDLNFVDDGDEQSDCWPKTYG